MDLSVLVEQLDKAQKIFKAVLAIFGDTPKLFVNISKFVTEAPENWKATAALFKAAEDAKPAADAAKQAADAAGTK
ncbi:hypothetical protein [Corynebacterium sp. HS2168-gen11]|uniref:hypothetical protein n=1 Tax=Corynebacterium sp. HS2168-gen11 TaxID=2974027 RepID=UPI00216ACA70|nr:hypothetical protein [Corynebacterium sp. HS2168-gen11]MCS4536130.1 hypothetical protein [Corynebacterium sp. HS2168-gen11]